jgi:hypothetical protein
MGAASLAALALGAALSFWASSWSALARGSAAAPKASNVAMHCAPNQQALIRQHLVDGELNVSVECASTPAVNVESALAPDGAQPVSAVYRAAGPSPVPTSLAPTRASRTARPSAPRRVVRRRDWRTDALIVGGSAGAGAGIGGLVGGKKGALIGAALGGGGAALFRAAQR